MTNRHLMEAKLVLRSVAAGTLLAVFMAIPVRAAVIATYSDQASFLAATNIPVGNTVTIGNNGPAPNITLTGTSASVAAGPVTVTATPGDLFGDGTVLSTDRDRAVLTISFDTPVLAVGLTPFISDASFSSLSGGLQVVLVGSDVRNLVVGTPYFVGYQSDTGISALQISVTSFDMNASAVAFATLADSIIVGQPPTQPIPAPGSSVLLSALVGAAFLQVARRTGGSDRSRSSRLGMTTSRSAP